MNIFTDKFSLKNTMSQERTVSEAIHYRRSVRIYDTEKAINTALVKNASRKLL
jgi:hypothetical protein